MPNTLFSQSYLEAGLRETEEYQQISPQVLSHFGAVRRPATSCSRMTTAPPSPAGVLFRATRLYDLDRDSAAYVMDSFPITRRNDERDHGRYLTKDLILRYMSALQAGDTETVVVL